MNVGSEIKRRFKIFVLYDGTYFDLDFSVFTNLGYFVLLVLTLVLEVKVGTQSMKSGAKLSWQFLALLGSLQSLGHPWQATASEGVKRMMCLPL